MTYHSVLRAAACCVLLGACRSEPPIPRLAFAPLISEADTAFGLLNRMDVRSCTIGVYDHSNRRFHLWSGGPSWQTFGSSGHGPGEIRHPMAIAVVPDGGLLTLDWGRRRIVRYDSGGTAIGDLAIGSALGRLGFVGSLLALRDGGWIEAPLGGQVIGRMAPFNPDSARLLMRYGPDGELRQSWGSLLTVPPEAAGRAGATELWQAGESFLFGDSLVTWFNRAGHVQIYALDDPAPHPLRQFTIDAPRSVVVTASSESVDSNGVLKASGPPFVPIGGPGAMDAEGRLFLILFESATDDDGATWPRERLAVFDLHGALIGQYRLSTRNTRTIRIARDGSILVLSHPSADDLDSWSLLMTEPLFQSDSTRCTWPQPSPVT